MVVLRFIHQVCLHYVFTITKCHATLIYRKQLKLMNKVISRRGYFHHRRSMLILRILYAELSRFLRCLEKSHFLSSACTYLYRLSDSSEAQRCTTLLRQYCCSRHPVVSVAGTQILASALAIVILKLTVLGCSDYRYC